MRRVVTIEKDGYEQQTDIYPRGRVTYAPTVEQGENALRAAGDDIAHLGHWSVWRCRLCGGVGFGGLNCASCGRNCDDASPMSGRPLDQVKR